MTIMPNAAFAQSAAAHSCSVAAEGVAYSADGTTSDIVWQLPDETPVALQINSQPFTVMMATPADLRDFAVGLTLAEGVISDPRRIEGVLVMPVENGITIDIAVPTDAIDPARLVRRAIEGRSGCGLCGVEDINAALRPLKPLTRSHSGSSSPAPSAILKAAAALSTSQPMNRINRSVHGAAWVAADGSIIMVREDVGRHNALDKLIGALVLADADRTRGFVLMTSRCSFEILQKCATAGIGAIVTVSAPTALALDIAKSANVFLASVSRDAVVVFNS